MAVSPLARLGCCHVASSRRSEGMEEGMKQPAYMSWRLTRFTPPDNKGEDNVQVSL